jgi:hypothetical protein
MVSLRYKAPLQKFLYKAPRLLKLQLTDGAGWETRRHRQPQRLLRTLMRRPDLAELVKELDLTVVYNRTSTDDQSFCTKPETHPGSSHRWHAPSDTMIWLETPEGQEDSFIWHQPARMLDRDFSMEWDIKSAAEHEPAAPGLLLALLPALKHLTIDNIYQMKIDVRDWDYEQNWDLEPLYRTALQRHVLDPREWYATKYFDHGVRGIAGFEKSLQHQIEQCAALADRRSAFTEITRHGIGYITM